MSDRELVSFSDVLDELDAIEREVLDTVASFSSDNSSTTSLTDFISALEKDVKTSSLSNSQKLTNSNSLSPSISRSPAPVSSLKQSASILTSISFSPNSIHAYVKDGNQKGIEDVLSKNKINIDMNDNNNEQTSLHVAIENNQTNIAIYLISNGSNLKLKDKIGRTPLIYAAR